MCNQFTRVAFHVLSARGGLSYLVLRLCVRSGSVTMSNFIMLVQMSLGASRHSGNIDEEADHLLEVIG